MLVNDAAGREVQVWKMRVFMGDWVDVCAAGLFVS